MGRPRRTVILGWDDLKEDEITVLRRIHEPRLLANQIAVLDGRTVARGSGVSQEEADEAEAAPGMLAPTQTPSSPAELTEFAHKMCWDIYQRDMAASEELRRQAHVLNERALQQGKQIDAMLAELVGMRADMMKQVQQQQAARPITVQDIKELIQAGAVLVHNMKPPGQTH